MPALLTIGLFAICYVLILFQFRLAERKRAYDVKSALINTGSLDPVIKRNINGLIIFTAGIILFLFMPYSFPFLQWPWSNSMFYLTLILAVLCFSLSYFTGVRNVQPHPFVSPKQAGIYFSTRVLFLFAYEIFFRVILFQVCLSFFSVPVSFTINLVLYVLLHIYSSRNEFIGSILFGLILCYITYMSSSVYPSIILHLSVSLPYEWVVFSRQGLKTKKIFV